MRMLRKILFWDDDLDIKQNVCLLFYRIFEFLIPGGIVLWCFLIEKLIDNEVTIWAKIGVSGIISIICICLMVVYFLGRHFRKKITKLTNKILECLDNQKKVELIKQKRIIEKWQEIYHNACFLAPFVIALLVVNLIETQLISIRGILFIIVSSMCIGFGFNCILQSLKTKIKIKE